MHNVTLEFDAPGTPEDRARCWPRRATGRGSAALSQRRRGRRPAHPARRLGDLFGIADPAWVGDGAGFWTYRGDSFGANYRIEHGWPRDAFFAKGTIGQYVIIIPSSVWSSFGSGRSPNWPPEADGVFELVSDVVAATGDKAKLAGWQ